MSCLDTLSLEVSSSFQVSLPISINVVLTCLGFFGGGISQTFGSAFSIISREVHRYLMTRPALTPTRSIQLSRYGYDLVFVPLENRFI